MDFPHCEVFHSAELEFYGAFYPDYPLSVNSSNQLKYCYDCEVKLNRWADLYASLRVHICASELEGDNLDLPRESSVAHIHHDHGLVTKNSMRQESGDMRQKTDDPLVERRFKDGHYPECLQLNCTAWECPTEDRLIRCPFSLF